MKLVAVAVNYRTKHLIPAWADSIRRHNKDSKLLLVDSFSSEAELAAVRETGEALDIHIIRPRFLQN